MLQIFLERKYYWQPKPPTTTSLAKEFVSMAADLCSFCCNCWLDCQMKFIDYHD